MKKLAFLLVVITLLVLSIPSYAINKEVVLAWNHDKSDLAGFKLKYGNEAGVYSTEVDVGMATPCTDLEVTPEEFCHKLVIDIPEEVVTPLFFAVSAYDAESNESANSEEATTVYDYELPPSVSDLSATFDKATSTLTFSWSYEDAWLPKIEKWSLWDSDNSEGPYTKIVDIPYDSSGSPPYTTDVVLSEASEVTKYYVMTSHRSAANNSASSVNSNQVVVVIDLMPPKSPFEFKIKIKQE